MRQAGHKLFDEVPCPSVIPFQRNRTLRPRLKLDLGYHIENGTVEKDVKGCAPRPNLCIVHLAAIRRAALDPTDTEALSRAVTRTIMHELVHLAIWYIHGLWEWLDGGDHYAITKLGYSSASAFAAEGPL